MLRRGAAPPSPVGVAAQSAAHKLCTQRAAPHHRGDSCIRGPLLPHAPPQQKLADPHGASAGAHTLHVAGSRARLSRGLSRGQLRRGGARCGLCSIDIVLHKERLLDGGLRAGDVLAGGGLGVGLRAREQLVLRLLVVLLLAAPNLDAGRLQRARVGEGEGECACSQPEV